jgi:thiamine-monophosphate kinase
MGEFDIIRSIIGRLPAPPGDVVLGPGDDCACLECGSTRLLLTDDAMVEEVHFTRAILEPRALGRRAATIAISDVAAMGGEPRWVLASCTAPPGSDELLVEIGEGLAGRCAQLGAALVGGNLSRSDRLSLSVSVAGTVDGWPLTRSGARPGDLVALTGPVGGASLGLGLLLDDAVGSGSEHLARMWRDPPARVAEGRALKGLARACIDLSDGLLQDLGHVAGASDVGARIELERLPLPEGYEDHTDPADPWKAALVGGEDYELLLAIAPADREAAARAAELSFIGSFTDPADGLVVVDGQGETRRVDPGGWDHFSSTRKT